MEERALWWVLNVALWWVLNVALWWVLNVALWWVLNVALWWVLNVALWWVLNVALWWVLNVALWWVLNVASFLTSFRSGCHALTGGMCDDLTTMSDCLIGGMVWSDHHIGLFDWWNGLIWPPCRIVWLVEWFDLTTTWCYVDRWNVWSDRHVVLGWWSMWYCVDGWNDRHMVLCWLVEWMIIWPPCGTRPTGGMHDDLTTMWY